MKTHADTVEAPAVSRMEEVLESGILPEDKHYRLTGKFADEETASAAFEEKDREDDKSSQQEQSEKESAPAADKDADTAAASAAASTEEQDEQKAGRERTAQPGKKTPQTSESRWAKITRENRQLREELERLKKARTAAPTESQRETQQTSQPAPDAAKPTANPRPKIDDVDPKTGKPKYKTFEEWEQAKDDWLKKETLREFQETSSKTEAERRQQEAERVLAVSLAKKFESSRAKHADFDEVALGEHLLIPKGSVTDVFLLDSDHAGEVAYYLGQHPEITQAFYEGFDPQTGRFTNKVSPQRQFRKLMEIEAQVSASTEAPRKQITQAPRPPHQTSGQGAVQKDAVQQAAEEGDFETYLREQNARELARRRKAK